MPHRIENDHTLHDRYAELQTALQQASDVLGDYSEESFWHAKLAVVHLNELIYEIEEGLQQKRS